MKLSNCIEGGAKASPFMLYTNFEGNSICYREDVDTIRGGYWTADNI